MDLKLNHGRLYGAAIVALSIWFLHGFYLGASALMLGLHLRHSQRIPTTLMQGGRHDGDIY